MQPTTHQHFHCSPFSAPVMAILTVLALVTVMPLISCLGPDAGSAWAQEDAAPEAGLSHEEELQLCLCRNVLARTLCKDPVDFSYVASYADGTHTFTVFYANKMSRMLCQVSDAFVHVKAELTPTIVRSIPYARDPAKPCATVDYVVPECPATWTISCCAKMTPEDLEQQKELEFWNRPIPEILRDELETGIAREQNASEQEAAP